MQIVKVQLPLTYPVGQEHPALVYDESREHMVQQEIDRAARSRMRRDKRAFFYASWSAVHGRWILAQRAAEQFW